MARHPFRDPGDTLSCDVVEAGAGGDRADGVGGRRARDMDRRQPPCGPFAFLRSGEGRLVERGGVRRRALAHANQLRRGSLPGASARRLQRLRLRLRRRRHRMGPRPDVGLGPVEDSVRPVGPAGHRLPADGGDFPLLLPHLLHPGVLAVRHVFELPPERAAPPAARRDRDFDGPRGRSAVHRFAAEGPSGRRRTAHPASAFEPHDPLHRAAAASARPHFRSFGRPLRHGLSSHDKQRNVQDMGSPP